MDLIEPVAIKTTSFTHFVQCQRGFNKELEVDGEFDPESFSLV